VASGDRQKSADSVEKGGLCWSRFQSFKKRTVLALLREF
jgi:hypothetical protein